MCSLFYPLFTFLLLALVIAYWAVTAVYPLVELLIFIFIVYAKTCKGLICSNKCLSVRSTGMCDGVSGTPFKKIFIFINHLRESNGKIMIEKKLFYQEKVILFQR